MTRGILDDFLDRQREAVEWGTITAFDGSMPNYLPCAPHCTIGDNAAFSGMIASRPSEYMVASHESAEEVRTASELWWKSGTEIAA